MDWPICLYYIQDTDWNNYYKLSIYLSINSGKFLIVESAESDLKFSIWNGYTLILRKNAGPILLWHVPIMYSNAFL